ncbi:MAG: hypothetical protein AB7I37_12230 [Pirellulales bacterium]
MLEINLNQLLWATRGLDWGYRKLHLPPGNRDDWTKIYDAVFAVDSRTPMFRFGQIADGGGKPRGYIACRVVDAVEEFRDSAGRTIDHEFLLLTPDTAVNDDWYVHVLDVLRPAYRQAHPLPANLTTLVSPEMFSKIVRLQLRTDGRTGPGEKKDVLVSSGTGQRFGGTQTLNVTRTRRPPNNPPEAQDDVSPGTGNRGNRPSGRRDLLFLVSGMVLGLVVPAIVKLFRQSTPEISTDSDLIEVVDIDGKARLKRQNISTEEVVARIKSALPELSLNEIEAAVRIERRRNPITLPQ